jgi:hypothetical protein
VQLGIGGGRASAAHRAGARHLEREMRNYVRLMPVSMAMELT